MMKHQSKIVLGIFLGHISYTEAATQPYSDELVQLDSLAARGRKHHHKHHRSLRSRENGRFQKLSQGPLETENTNPFVVFGPPTTPGEVPAGGQYKSRLNSTPKAEITHQPWTNNTWGLNKVLKHAGNREDYYADAPEGYKNAEGLEWVESGYNSTRELTEEEQKSVYDDGMEWAANSTHTHDVAQDHTIYQQALSQKR